LTTTLLLLCGIAFLAGFVDAIVGGGGLIQTPAGLIMFPHEPVARVIGSLKIPSFTGTVFAAATYLKKVKIPLTRLLAFTSTAFIAAFTGSFLLTKMSNHFMKPIIFGVLVIIAFYTYSKKELGQQLKIATLDFPIYKGIFICLVLGFYDGFIGPGAGSEALSMNVPFANVKLSDTLAKMLPYDASGEVGILYQQALSRGL
jgi:uncharacterized membrane protein YfcA